jgi:ribonuclease P protein component
MSAGSLGRLRKGREFDSVYNEGTVIGGPLFVLRGRPNGDDVVRWGFAVGKKLLPGAVGRNRQRRRLRAAAQRVDVLDGWDVVLTARPRLLEASFAEISGELRRMAAKLCEAKA